MLITFIVLCALLIVCDFFIWDEGIAAFFGVVGMFVVVGFVFGSYVSHSYDLGTIRSYAEVVEVQTKRINDLEIRLKKIVPVGQQRVNLLLNADSPIKSLVEQISAAQKDLSQSETEIAKAKVNISRRKAGPFWFVVSIYGDH